ncbi:MAG: VWA domain-containing protein [Anaerolineales bacterium]|nr:VWA domain-containing protein [Anaerolineales bacterium]
MSSKPSYYEILGLPKEATQEEIRRAYRELSLRQHPDINHSPGANTQFLNLKEAFETLINPSRRKDYDHKLVQESDAPILENVLYSRSRLPDLKEPQLLYVYLDYSVSSKFASQVNPTLNFCLVIDRSTSMQGERLDTVKAAAIEFIRQSKEDDVLSLVTFSDRAEVVLPAKRYPDHRSLEAQIHFIQASGGTEIYQGLEAGFQQIQWNQNRALVNHIILITDGHTYGDDLACLDLANRAASQGVRITALGIGSDWNDDFLDNLTQIAGGNTYYISKTSDLRKLMHEKFNSLNQVFAERVFLKLKTAPRVALGGIYRIQPEAAPLTASEQINLGTILRDTNLSILLEFIVQPIDEDLYRREIANGTVNLILPSDPGTTHRIPVTLSRIVGSLDKKEMPPQEIIQALTHITLYRMQERARQEASAGNVDEASSRLQRLATQFLSIGEKDLAQTALMEAERIQQTSMLSPEGEKAIKYATRSLMLPRKAKEVRSS